MVRKAIQIITSSVGGLREAAFWLALFALLSQFLALVRDRLLAHHFGAGLDLDIYYAAFKIPDLIFVTVASLVSISALVPLFAKRETEGERHLRDATDSLFTTFSLFIIFACVLFWFLMPTLIPFFFGGLTPAAMGKIIFLSRILLLSPLLLGFSNFFGSIVQYEKRFILYSLSPLLYNIGIIVGLVFGVEEYGIIAPVFGVVLGAFLHLFLQAAFVLTSNLKPHFTFLIKWKDVAETAMLSVPRTFALSIVTFVGFFFAALASRFGEGSIAIFNLSFNLQSAPLSLIGVSFSLAAFPALAVSAARKNVEDIIERISDGLRQIVFWSLPFTALFIVLRAHIVRVVLGSGSFDWDATRLTAAVLALFVVSTVFQSIQLFLSRSHYALGKTRAPLLGNLVGGAVSVLLAFIFATRFEAVSGFINTVASMLKVSHLPQEILILPLAYSIGSVVTAVILYFALGKNLAGEIWHKTRNLLPHSLFAAFFVGGASYLTLALSDGLFDLDTFLGVFGHGLIAGLVGIVIGATILHLLGNNEIREILAKFQDSNTS